MRTNKWYFPIVVATALFAVSFTSCSDDEEGDNGPATVDVTTVFTGGMPKVAGDIQSLMYNEDGLVSGMKTTDADITFEYANVMTRSASTASMVTMTLDYGRGRNTVLKMALGRNGFVESVEQTYSYDNTTTDYWSFGYNSDNQLNYMKRSEGDNEETFISYQNGDITKVKQTSEDGASVDYETYILYTSPSVTSPIENKGCIMLFDHTFDIDMDEMCYAYYAGLLGKATRHLPMGYSDENKSRYYDWEFYPNGYPKSITVSYEKHLFEW